MQIVVKNVIHSYIHTHTHICIYVYVCVCVKLLSVGSVQSLSRVQLFVAPWTAACQASLSITNSWSPPKPMSIESVMPSNHLILSRPLLPCPQSFPASGSFPVSQLFVWGGQIIGVSASASVLPMNTQDWSLLGWTGWISMFNPFHPCELWSTRLLCPRDS